VSKNFPAGTSIVALNSTGATGSPCIKERLLWIGDETEFLSKTIWAEHRRISRNRAAMTAPCVDLDRKPTTRRTRIRLVDVTTRCKDWDLPLQSCFDQRPQNVNNLVRSPVKIKSVLGSLESKKRTLGQV
jgi:hypothetical protein